MKFIQVVYQFKNRLIKPSSFTFYFKEYRNENYTLSYSKLPNVFPVLKIVNNEFHFTFLNQVKSFPSKVDWGYEGYGKLWNYNLQYVDFLRQEDVSEEIKLTLLSDLYSALEQGALKLEPYPVSLRIMNVIRFLSQQENRDEFLQKRIFGEVNYLSKHLEYHLLGNHLLENGFALLMGGHFFNYIPWIKTAENLLKKELKEQILADGGHFELSPMYHKIILFRVLEAIDYLPDDSSVKSICHLKAIKMIEWLKEMTFSNGDIPHFNDSSDGIAFTSHQMFEYAERIGVKIFKNEYKLGESGYRKFYSKVYECVVDVAPIGSSYQPGHGHSDALSFILYYNHNPFLVEAGTSTYNDCLERQLERSTRSHNTVEVSGLNQSDVYSAFRVGKRAQVTINEEGSKEISASHDGYKVSIGITHQRHFLFDDFQVIIKDVLSGIESNEGIALFHFHPDVNFNVNQNEITFDNGTTICFTGSKTIKIETYLYAFGFNKTVPASVVQVYFTQSLETVINFNQV